MWSRVRDEPAPDAQHARGREPHGLQAVVLLLMKAFFPLAVLIMSVLGAILFGLATPSEAAAIGALGSVVLAIGYRAMSWGKLREPVFLTARTSAMVCYLFVGSWLFSSIFSYLGGEHLIKEFVLGLNLNTVTFLLLTQLIIFLLGWPLEWSEIIIIFVPIFLPLLQHFGIDPIFFGILVALNLQTSFLTPPMAMSAYYLKGVSPPSVLLAPSSRAACPSSRWCSWRWQRSTSSPAGVLAAGRAVQPLTR
jgi:tripartite ATP-independent transporter DctM subunit